MLTFVIIYASTILLLGVGALGLLARESYCNSQAMNIDEDKEDILIKAKIDESTALI